MRLLRDQTICVVVDIQEKLFPHMHEGEKLERNVIKLIHGLNFLGIPILLTQQYTKGLGPTVPALTALAGIRDPIEKQSFSCCDEPVFMAKLNASGKTNVILCGIETHVCILQTAIDMVSQGFKAVVVEDCVSSRHLQDKETALKRLQGEGIILTGVESLLFELLRTSGTEEFKAISKLIR